MNKTNSCDYLRALDSIDGWLYPDDVQLFQEIDALQRLSKVNGDLLEIGVYHGKSAILLGYFPRQDERLVLCDLFQSPGQTRENQAEKQFWYPELTRETFEGNYLRFHHRLPSIVICPSTKLIQIGRLTRTFRFIHIDGSHLYSIVRQDICTAKLLLKDKGIVVFDDYRSIHTPGVAAAIWQEVFSGGLIPLCLTPQKMYATWDRTHLSLLKGLRAWAMKRGDISANTEMVCGRKLLRIQMKG